MELDGKVVAKERPSGYVESFQSGVCVMGVSSRCHHSRIVEFFFT